MKEEKSIFKSYAPLVVLGVVLFVALEHLSKVWLFSKGLLSIVMPFIVGLSIAFILNVLLRFIEEKLFLWTRLNRLLPQKIQRPLAILLTYGSVILIGYIATFLVVPELVRTMQVVIQSLESFLAQLPTYIKQVAANFNINPNIIGEVDFATNQLAQNMIKLITESGIGVFNATVSVTSSIFGTIFNLVMSLAFSIYALSQKELLGIETKRTLRAFLSPKRAESFIEVGRLSHDIFSKFVFGQVTEATILGTLCGIGMMLLNLPYALMIGVVVGFTALIPVFGAFLGIGVGALVLLMTSLKDAIIFVVFMIVLQQLEGNLIYPRVVGKSVGLPSIWVLLAVLVGGSLMGPMGMLISVPLCSVLYSLIKKEVEKRSV